MDRNKIKQVDNMMEVLHGNIDGIHSNIMRENFSRANELVTEMEESLKHLKQNLKVDEI